VLAPGEPSTDPYKATPDELYARGKAHFDAGRTAEAAAPLEELFGSYTLRDDVAKDAARMLLAVHIKEYQPRKVVQYFEVLKEKAPELVIPFDQIRAVGRAYRDLGEHERAYLVWRAIAEASHLEDAQVGEVLRQRARRWRGSPILLDLWREYPSSASLQSDFFGPVADLAGQATRATTEAGAARELARPGGRRSDLLLQAIRLVQVFLCQSPATPWPTRRAWPWSATSWSWRTSRRSSRLAGRFARLYPGARTWTASSTPRRWGRFHLGQYDRAIAVAEAIARATYKDADGVEQPSPNKWQALYILGQIHDARRQPAQALAYYEQVAAALHRRGRRGQGPEAGGAVVAGGRRGPPGPAPAVAGGEEEEIGVGFRAVPAAPPGDPPRRRASRWTTATSRTPTSRSTRWT
jgi:hypothetical protein